LVLGEGPNYTVAVQFLDAVADYADSPARRNEILYRAADRHSDAQQYQQAFDLFTALGEYADAAVRAVDCQQTVYDELVARYSEARRAPEGFDAPLLQGFADADKFYRIYRLQQSEWAEQDMANNLAELYALGEFENMAQHGFLDARIMGRRYSANGYYFEIDAFGEAHYNLPSYRLSGYYGLYFFIDGEGVYSIGSDEKQSWTPMFRLTMLDDDRTLQVYCYTDGRSYDLVLEE
jgi:hypothetical protein